MVKSFLVLVLLILIFRGSSPAAEGWLGAYTTPVDSLPPVEDRLGGERALLGAAAALRVTHVFPFSPAEEGGLLPGDLIVALGGEPFTCVKESIQAIFRRRLDRVMAGELFPMRVVRTGVSRALRMSGRSATRLDSLRFWFEPSRLIDSLRSGDTLRAEAVVEQRVVDLPIVLGPRSEAKWPAPEGNDEIYRPGFFVESDFAPLVRELVDGEGIRKETDDLIERLGATHRHADPFRPDPLIYAHRDPFRLEAVAGRIARVMDGSLDPESPANRIRRVLNWRSEIERSPGVVSSPSPLVARIGAGSDGPFLARALKQIENVLERAARNGALAFAALGEDEVRFLAEQSDPISDVFSSDIYIHFDKDRERYEKNRRLIEIASRVDHEALDRAAIDLSLLADPRFARALADSLAVLFADSLEKEILYERETPRGKIVIAGTANNRHVDHDVAFLIDLGGDDFYTGNAGGARGPEIPAAVCIDIAGNDAYESTEPVSQGSGSLGVGALVDMEGDDRYVAMRWGEGTGYFGIGWLHDLEGNDVYRGRSFCQGVALFGTGLLIDESGEDRYEGDAHVQGTGLPGGVGVLSDRAGDDEYYAKGVYPTGYGTPGIFDAWSQGCGVGFRTLASGGIGVLVDGGGADRMEAGNFSQGGGYYYGMGIVHARGDGDDIYVGSRYNQGFSAHQAVGVFLEEGGNDFYTTRHGVAQGLAWDECVTLFVDRAGDDIYEGGGFFSQGASAHNSFSFFLDRGGRDEYRYLPGPARTGGNTYHGGTSLSLFIDEGGATDLYTSEKAANDTLFHAPEHGFFIDR